MEDGVQSWNPVGIANLQLVRGGQKVSISEGRNSGDGTLSLVRQLRPFLANWSGMTSDKIRFEPTLERRECSLCKGKSAN